MANKSFCLSGLAFEMLIASQNEEKVIIPIESVLKNSHPEELYTELYSLFSNNVVINNAEKNCFDINEELASILKSIFSSRAVLKVTGNFDFDNTTYYYLAPYGIAQLKNNIIRKCVVLSSVDINELVDSILSDLNLPEDYQNPNNDTDNFINSVDEYFKSNDYRISTEMLKISTDEFKKKFEEAVGCIDLIIREDLNVTSRIAVYKKLVYYKIAQISIDDVGVSNYSRANFSKAIESITGEFL